MPLALFDLDMKCVVASELWIEQHGGDSVDIPGFERPLDPAVLVAMPLEHYEQMARHPDGTMHWFRWSAMPWRTESGRLAGVIMSSEDITDRKHTEQELREREINYRTIFDESPFAIALTRWSDLAIVNANAAFARLFESGRDQMIGKSAVDIGLSTLEQQAQIQNELESHGLVRNFKCTFTTKSGSSRVLSLNETVVVLDGEKHILTTIRDITELVRARETAKLYREAKELDELKSRFFAAVSHELRTPLTLILGPTERLMASPDLAESHRRDLTVIARNARTLLDHVNDLLDVSKLEAHRMQIEYVETDVSHLVRLVASYFETLAADKGITFSLDLSAGLYAQVDPKKLQHVVMNVLSNALKFTPAHGRVRVTLRLKNNRVRLEVGDSGPGIPPDMREVVFEPFRQLEGGPTRRFGGTGLGLAIARELVLLHRGTIRADQAPEGGALVVIELPEFAPPGTTIHKTITELVRADEVQRTVQALREEAPRRGGRIGERGGHVLVVEDNPEMNLFISEALALDHRVETAHDGQEGLRKVLALVPDVVVTDIMMPVMSGDEMVRAIRANHDLDRVAIIALTAKADDEIRVRMLREGVQDYINKPFSMDELRVRIDNLLARKLAEEHAARLQWQLEEVTAASHDVTEAIASLPEASVRAVLHTIALKAQTLTGAEYVAVGIGNEPGAPIDQWVFIGIEPGHARAVGAEAPVGDMLARLGRDGVERIRDLRRHPAYRGVPPGHPTLTSVLAAPIAYHGKRLGTVCLANKRGADEFSDQDARLVEMLAARVGVAIETAGLYRTVGMERTWLQAVIDQMPEAIVLVDTTGRIVSQNRAALGYAAEDGGIHLERPSGETIAARDTPIAVAISREQSTHALELVARCRDGRDMPVLVSATPIRMADGNLAGATMVLQDISMLKELERLREEWASIVAHDLQQPINSIVLLTDMLLRGTLAPTEREKISRVRALSFRLSRMVSDLSDVSQLEAHRFEIDHERVDVCSLAREVVERLPEVAARARLVVADRVLVVRGDAGRLEQVLTNLLSNAVKYAPRDTPIFVEVFGFAGVVQISVTNTGPGIPADELPALFKRFSRTRDARRGAAKGTGLGLYIAKGIVEAHGGRIWAESVPHQATSFHFILPLAREEVAQEHVATS